VLLAVIGAVGAVIAAVLVLSSWDRSDDAAAGEAAADAPAASAPAASAPAPAAASTTPTSPPPTTPAPTTSAAAPTSDVPVEFADAMQQIGIPLDPHTGWVVAEGICVRLGQPSYDQFRMSEGVERLFPSVTDEQAHEFVAMVAESVCQG
jgi:hypothetical protein